MHDDATQVVDARREEARPPLRPAERLAPRWDGRQLGYLVAKRAIDIVGGSIGLVLSAPLMLVAAIAVRLESDGPAIFRQTRIGQYGQPFTFYKFRGMYVDARERFPELYDYNYSDDEVGDVVFHPTVDPRVTRVGRFLRRTSIDELPNFWNVVKGDISLVGPRPEIPEMMPYYGEHRDTVLSVKPGVTSLSKVSGRDELNFAETLELDLKYVRERSLALDLKILWRTAITVVRQDGVA